MCLSVAIERPGDVLARGGHLGFEWIVNHNTMGYRCGYVRVPRGHPWHGRVIDDIDADVHGGITFAEPDVPCGGDRDDDAYWIGFDSAHARDLPDPELPVDPSVREINARMAAIHGRYPFPDRTAAPAFAVRDQSYMEAECLSLCRQAREAAAAAVAAEAGRSDAPSRGVTP